MTPFLAASSILPRSNPVLMIFEDAHWTDPTSLEVLGRTVDRLRTLGVLLIVTYRLEFDPPWRSADPMSLHSILIALATAK